MPGNPGSRAFVDQTNKRLMHMARIPRSHFLDYRLASGRLRKRSISAELSDVQDLRTLGITFECLEYAKMILTDFLSSHATL
jgi:hypothetical protein